MTTVLIGYTPYKMKSKKVSKDIVLPIIEKQISNQWFTFLYASLLYIVALTPRKHYAIVQFSGCPLLPSTLTQEITVHSLSISLSKHMFTVYGWSAV